jgi:predicted small secreted protein
MTDKIKLLVLFLLLSTTGVSLAACNTMEGFGRDVEAAGEGLQEEAD